MKLAEFGLTSAIWVAVVTEGEGVWDGAGVGDGTMLGIGAGVWDDSGNGKGLKDGKGKGEKKEIAIGTASKLVNIVCRQAYPHLTTA